MNKRNASQSSLFLIELIFVIFFFSLTSMLCVQVFVKAHLTGKEAKEESLGSTLISSVAEALSYMDTSCLLYTSPSPRDKRQSRMPSSA